MAKIEEKVEGLLAKHPSLTKVEAIKIITEKNERKRKKRAAKTKKSDDQKRVYEAKLSGGSATTLPGGESLRDETGSGA